MVPAFYLAVNDTRSLATIVPLLAIIAIMLGSSLVEPWRGPTP